MRPFDQIGQAPTPTPATSEPPKIRRRAKWMRPLAAVALTVSAVAAGAAGGVVAMRFDPATEISPQPGVTPAASATGAAQTIASAVYEQTHGSVVQLIVAGGTPRSSGSGSGVVVDARGYILTNYHVIEGARGITVRFDNGATRPAQVANTDPANDLAVVKVDLPAGVPVATLGDSDAVKVGELAIAIGSPFGLSQTVTQGIVSATDRTYQPTGGPARRGLIQTDAPINPGNSGGPLINAAGEVIGINSFNESPVQGSVGIGFAVPINTAKELLPTAAPAAAGDASPEIS